MQDIWGRPSLQEKVVCSNLYDDQSAMLVIRAWMKRLQSTCYNTWTRGKIAAATILHFLSSPVTLLLGVTWWGNNPLPWALGTLQLFRMAFWWWYKFKSTLQRLESPLYKLPVVFSKQRVLVVWREAAMTREWLDRLAGTIWVRAASLGREGSGQVEASSLLIKPLPLLLVKVDHFLQRLDFLGGQIGPFPPFNKEGHQRIATNQGSTPKPFYRPYNTQKFDEEPKSFSQMSCGWCSDL